MTDEATPDGTYNDFARVELRDSAGTTTLATLYTADTNSTFSLGSTGPVGGITYNESTNWSTASITPGSGTYRLFFVVSDRGDTMYDSALAVDNIISSFASFGPEMAVLGNGQVIADGDISPSLTDHTDFGSVLVAGGQITRTFTISNSGGANLNLTGSPLVSISGPAAVDFTVVASPTTPIAAGNTTTFQVRFDPSVVGTRVATVTIANNDSNENPYDFAVQGIGTVPTIQFTQATYQVNEDGTTVGATVTLTRSGDTGAVSQVQVSFTDNSATGGGTDYTSTPIAITFPAGDPGSQTVSVPITQDFIDETTESLTMTVSSVSNAQIGSQDIATLEIVDDDTAGTVVNPTSLTISEPNGSDTFNIRLTSQPTATVTIDLTVSDASECGVDTDPVTLDAATWQTGVTVTVTAVDDQISDGPQPCNLTTAQTASSDPVYNSAFNPNDVTVTVNDNEVKGVTVTESGGGTDVTEGGAIDTYTVRLNTIPTATVTISVATGGQVNPVANLLFATDLTALNPQTVTVSATDDIIVEGDHSQVIGHSTSGGGYNSVSINDVTAAITDNDLAYAISAGQTTVTEGHSGATTISFTLTRSGAVTTTTGSVDFSLGGTATGSDYNNVSPTPGAVSFTAGQTQRQITLDVLGDFGVEPDETIIVTLSNASAPGSGTATITTASAQTTITNDDSAGFTVSPTSGLTTTEAGGTASFSVRLNSQPSAVVTITLTSSDPGEGTPSPASLVFNPANWNSNQSVTVTGQDDLVADGDIAYTIQTGVISSDSDYSSLDPADVALTNLDNDTPGYTITPNNFTVSEGGSQVVSITLYTPPTADVIISLSSSDPSQCTVSPASVTLNAGNYQTGVSFTVSGVYDGLDDGTQPCTIVTTVSSSDSAYGRLDPADIALSVFERRIYLPLVINNFSASPDLVIDSLTAGPGGPQVVIRNAGNTAVTDAFWVDVYFNPNQTPSLNKPWNTIATHGAVWGVTKSLNPGEALTLNVGDAYYYPTRSSSSFPAGAQVYAYVDSINYTTSYGNVQESNENNNLSGPVTAAASSSPVVEAAAAPSLAGLPER